MYGVRLQDPLDLAGWRRAARALRLGGVAPEQVAWRVGDASGGLFDGPPPPEPPSGAGFSAPRELLDLAADLVCHRSDDRFDLLYRLLWRLKDEPALLRITTDADVAEAHLRRKAVQQATHKMHAFVRFRLVNPAFEAAGERETYVAWFEPPHRVLTRGIDYFVKRMGRLAFSILTPDACAHWDGAGGLSFTPGLERREAPGEDELETYWRTYFASVFNPARVNPRLMTQHMPRRYWGNLPEAAVIPELAAAARGRTDAMVEAAPTPPSPRTGRVQVKRAPAPPPPDAAPADLPEVAAAIQACRRCDLWRHATQGVPGEGPPQAPLMLVGEQPGDMEDLAGHPFVGPAGEVLNRALAEAGVNREEAYVTNAVKHFKHELRGKRRLHSRPNGTEIEACRWWLQTERRLVRPKVIVALGATAATAVFGRALSVLKNRGVVGEVEGGGLGFLTVHPSYLLRIPEPGEKARAYDAFVADLAAAHALLKAA